jgi:hypothetical protein
MIIIIIIIIHHHSHGSDLCDSMLEQLQREHSEVKKDNGELYKKLRFMRSYSTKAKDGGVAVDALEAKYQDQVKPSRPRLYH